MEIVGDVLEAIGKTDRLINAYIEADAEAALRQAREADKARADGVDAPLLGVPLALKDILNARGMSMTCASAILRGYRSPYDATAVARLRKAGAVFLGRTNMDEFGMGSSTENSVYGPTRNPWDSSRVPGGSSGGSAACVAADEAVAALGTDTGGSVRQPAAFCGCVGFKPSYGRISRYGLTAYASSLDQVGPLTKDARDAAILLGQMAGADEMDSTSSRLPVPDYEACLDGVDIKGMRFGLPREFFVPGSDPEILALTMAAAKRFGEMGAEAVEISLPSTRHAVAAYYLIASAEASSNLARFDGVRYGFRAAAAADPTEMYTQTRSRGFGPEVKRRIILGTYALSSGYYEAYYGRAQKVRSLVRREFEDAFGKCDVILAPVTPTAAFRLGEKTGDPLQMYLGDIFTAPVNLAGVCAISTPCGFTPERLPAGLQIIGPAFGEETVLRAARAYEISAQWRSTRPPAAAGGDNGGDKS